MLAASCPAGASGTGKEGTGADVLFLTGFEVSEGYSDAEAMVPLRGQQGWQGEGSGGNGLVWEFFEGWGQQAYLGFLAPAPKDDFLVLWKPLGLPDPDPARPVWKFSTLMQVVDSTNGQYDDFRWSVYNRDGHRLLTVDFDNSSLTINFAREDSADFTPTGFEFRNDVLYWLEILVNFGRNSWMARLNGTVIVDSQPLVAGEGALNLGDVDPVWAIREPGAPGDNYLLFDEYSVSLEPGRTIPPSIELLGVNAQGEFELYLHGERGLTYSIEVSGDLREWLSLGEYSLEDGFLYFVDTSSPGFDASFYRAREVQP
ncbi:MAG: hypothetical protein KDM81_14515 [Verrucomicrobiae bacterium]|nr:hypothetical protein [Verrucomicrobiae bacterium]